MLGLVFLFITGMRQLASLTSDGISDSRPETTAPAADQTAIFDLEAPVIR